VWSRRPLHTSRGELGAGGFDDLLSLDAVDELLSRRGLRTPFIRVARNGDVVAERRFTRSGAHGRGRA